MPFLIWGSRGLTSTHDHGRFYCPQCNRDNTAYTLKGVRSWFTLYFIPIFPIGSPEMYVECSRCAGTFKEAVLDLRPPTEGERIVAAVAEDLRNGMPIEEAEKRLVEIGVERESVKSLVDAISEGKVKQCPVCGLHLLESAPSCQSCTASRS